MKSARFARTVHMNRHRAARCSPRFILLLFPSLRCDLQLRGFCLVGYTARSTHVRTYDFCAVPPLLPARVCERDCSCSVETSFPQPSHCALSNATRHSLHVTFVYLFFVSFGGTGPSPLTKHTAEKEEEETWMGEEVRVVACARGAAIRQASAGLGRLYRSSRCLLPENHRRGLLPCKVARSIGHRLRNEHCT